MEKLITKRDRAYLVYVKASKEFSRTLSYEAEARLRETEKTWRTAEKLLWSVRKASRSFS